MENLKSKIRFIQEVQTKEIIENAKEQAKRIVDDTKEKAEKTKNQKMKELMEKLREKEASEIALVRLEGRKKVSNARFHLLEQAFQKALEDLKEFSSKETAIYRESLEKLIVEAATKLGGTEVEIVTNSTDREFANKKTGELEKKISKLKGGPTKLRVSSEKLSALGGVVVRSVDKRQIFNNTIEARLIKIRRTGRSEIYESLFGEERE